MMSTLPLIAEQSPHSTVGGRPTSHRRAVTELDALRHRLKRLRQQEEHARITNENAAKRTASIEAARRQVKASTIVSLPPATTSSTSSRRRHAGAGEEQQPSDEQQHSISSVSARDALREQRRARVLDMRREHLLNQCRIDITRNEMLAASLEIKKHVADGDNHRREVVEQCQARKAVMGQDMRSAYQTMIERDECQCRAEIAKLLSEERMLRSKLEKAKKSAAQPS